MAYDPVLGNRFLFEPEALEANGEGRLSEEQERMLEATVRVMRRREPRVKVLLIIVFAVVITLVVIAISATPGGGMAGDIVAGVILAWILGIILFFRARGRRTREAMEMRRVLTAEGALRIVSDSTQVWWANVGQARFSVDRYQADVLAEGRRYRVHYIQLPDGAMPLSMESAELA